MQFMKVCPIPNYFFEKNFIKIRNEILNQIYSYNFNKIYVKFNFLISTVLFK